MGDAGILKPTERVELIRGEIIEMSPIGSRHVAFVNNLTQLLVTRLAGRAIVSVQNPVALDDDTEPEPDLAILRHRRTVPYKESEPATEDVLLLIEVGDTSLTYDRRTKRYLYAEAGIPEYWVVDAESHLVERWLPLDERPEILTETLVWRPAGASEALVIDLAVLFRAALGD